MKDQPNWAEIVSALATSATALIGLPAVFALLRDRAELKSRSIRVIESGSTCDGALTILRVKFAAPDQSEALYAAITLRSSGALATEDQYKVKQEGALGYGGERAFILPTTTARKIRVPLSRYLDDPSGNVSAFFAVVGGSLSDGLIMKVAVVTTPRRKTITHRKAIVSRAH